LKKSLLNLNKKFKEKRLNAYYLSHSGVSQSYNSRLINYFFTRFLVLISAFLIFIFVSEGKHVYASFIAGSSVLIIYHLIVKTIEQKKLDKIIKQVREKVATEDFWKKIQTLDKDAFVLFLKEILEKLPDFSDVEIADNLDSEGINLICKHKGEWSAIQCHLLDGDDAVEARNARELSRAMSKRKYKKGFIISTTDFRDNTKLFCNLIKEKRQINLLSKKELIEMAKDAGKFPSEEEVKNLILKKVEHRERVWQEAREKIFARPRIMSYFIYGTFLILLSMVINLRILKYIYFICALVLYMFGIIGFIFSLKREQVASKWQNKIQ